MMIKFGRLEVISSKIINNTFQTAMLVTYKTNSKSKREYKKINKKKYKNLKNSKLDHMLIS